MTGALVKWKDMTAAQKIEAIELRPQWKLDRFADFEFWIKEDGHVSRRGGHHALTEEAFQRELKDWGSYRQKPDEPHAFKSCTFHLSKE